MLTDILFFEPHDQARRKPRPALPIPELSIDTAGRFRFNLPATQLLELSARVRVQLGSSQQDKREWFLMKVDAGGFLLRDIGGRPGQPQYGFVSADLRQHLLTTLPHAPVDKLLKLRLDPMTEVVEGAEIWPLLTAPYWQPPAAPEASPEPPLHPRVLAMTAPPGLLATVRQARLP